MLLPFSPSAVLPLFFSGPVAHDAHHLRGFGNYAKFFTHWDALFATQTK
jgi:sterol desaturase/sphingolipid hydroxylase (fatty acid hydroxylase superfamily)